MYGIFIKIYQHISSDYITIYTYPAVVGARISFSFNCGRAVFQFSSIIVCKLQTQAIAVYTLMIFPFSLFVEYYHL